MGNARVPTALKVLRGTDQPCRRNNSEPELEKPLNLKPPTWLKKEGRKEWIRLAQMLADAGVLKEPDLFVFAQYCKLCGHIIELFCKAQKPVPDSALSQLRYLSSLFGLDPSTRSKIVATPTTKKNKFK